MDPVDFVDEPNDNGSIRGAEVADTCFASK